MRLSHVFLFYKLANYLNNVPCAIFGIFLDNSCLKAGNVIENKI